LLSTRANRRKEPVWVYAESYALWLNLTIALVTILANDKSRELAAKWRLTI
jgi:hypothetical protein